MELSSSQCIWKRCLLLWLIYISAVSLCESNDGVDEPKVYTSLGEIIGSTVEINGITVHQFLSVPYAKSPTGELRFKKPEPTEPWSEPLLAKKEPPACTQFTQNPFPWYDDRPGKSEDCLFLNIWRPSDASSENPKAVLYWIFGGGFFVGSTRQGFQSGETLSALGDIIVVTVNYRLGSFGFLYSGTSEAPGNVGLWDILAGLQWVNDHINAFGGDVTRITIAGESAGSIAVGLLSVSPMTQDLYTRQIMQSGSPAYTMADNNSQNMYKSQKIAELVNCASDEYTLEDNPTEVVACLRGINAMELIQAESSLIPRSSRSFLPQFGDEILPENPREAIIAGKFHNKDILIGNSKDEGSFQISTRYPDVFGFFGQNEPLINKSTGESFLRQMFGAFPFAEDVVNHYLPDSIHEEDYESVSRQVYSASGDFSLLCPTVYYAEKFAQTGNNVHFYLWSHRPSTTPWAPWMGVPHYSEVAFLFGMPVKDPEVYEADEIGLSMDFIEKWSNFVKHGIPMERWPLYSRDNPVFLYLDTARECGIGPHRRNCDFFRQYFGF